MINFSRDEKPTIDENECVVRCEQQHDYRIIMKKLSDSESFFKILIKMEMK